MASACAFAAASPLGSGVDLNSIPAAAVERIEVLTDGASAIYGSDAIGGVINIILKTNYQGAQFSTNYGISDRDDGARRGVSFVFGQTSDKGSIMAGVDYNKFDPVEQKNRDFSKDAVSLEQPPPMAAAWRCRDQALRSRRWLFICRAQQDHRPDRMGCRPICKVARPCP